ncbi:MAG: hypothetical protein KKD39_01390, partial [Candidatus Altiarchaeota archaeon]|nr:hypothetical protein [Candidatus Altiarchaeota archaeon]
MSKWHAVDAVEDAIEATKNLLFTPVRYSFWLKLALVVYLLGSGGLNLRVNQDWQSMDDMVKDITFDSQTIFL